MLASDFSEEFRGVSFGLVSVFGAVSYSPSFLSCIFIIASVEATASPNLTG